jgi:hypothetical protein
MVVVIILVSIWAALIWLSSTVAIIYLYHRQDIAEEREHEPSQHQELQPMRPAHNEHV